MATPDSNCGSIQIKQVVCGDCGELCPRRGPRNLFCVPCSNKRSAARKALYQKTSPNNKRLKNACSRERQSFGAEFGLNLSESLRWSLDNLFPDESGMNWVRRISQPYSIAFSKNYIYGLTHRGHVALRQEKNGLRERLCGSIREAVEGVPIVQNKVWLDILIEKPSNKGDAVNFIDCICDAVKEAIGIDDRWFCIKRLDWQIIKKDPCIFVGVGQEASVNVGSCSHCGRLLEYENFWRSKGRPSGRHQACKDCLKGRKREYRKR